MINAALLDLAGVVYEGREAVPGAAAAITRLRDAGLHLRFVTNTTRSTKHTILKRLAGFGVEVTDSELFTPAQAARNWLLKNGYRPHLLVHPDLTAEFEDEFGGSGRAVVVGDAGRSFDYASLNRAFRALIGGAPLLALAKNRMFKDADGKLSLDAGAFVAALEFASEREAIVFGKPAPAFYHAALVSMDCPGNDAVMVGDDAEADVAGALQAGVGAALLVRTGKYREDDERRFDPSPTATIDDLPAAADWIVANRGRST
jgi:HAD superfamily hydrolase (TIGR01458 family)